MNFGSYSVASPLVTLTPISPLGYFGLPFTRKELIMSEVEEASAETEESAGQEAAEEEAAEESVADTADESDAEAE
jgi:hypothetical protein